MPWKKLTSGLETIFGYPGADRLVLDSKQLRDVRALLKRLGFANLRPRDIADGYLSTVPKKQRSGKGVYYTPHKVVEFILDETIPGPRLGRQAVDPYPDGFRVLEPGCGAGYFLLGAYRRFRTGYKKAGWEAKDAVRMILENRIAAIDIDPSALLTALTSIIVEAGNELDLALEDGPVEISFHRADFLDKDNDREKSALGKLLSGGVPVIFGNPPYVSFYAKRARSISVAEKNYYKKNYLMGKGRINTFCLFMERAFDLLQPAGVLGFIIPNTFLIMKSYEPLRDYFLEQGWVRCIVDLSLKVFPEVEVPTCVISVEKKDLRALPFPREVRTGFWESVRDDTPGALENSPQDMYRRLPYSMYNIHIRSDDWEILEAIERSATPLGELCDVRDGINPANMTEKIVVQSEKRMKTPFRKVLRGKDIAPYQLSWDNMWVRYDKNFIDSEAGDYCFFREERIFLENPKILTRQTANRIVAAWDEEKHYALNTIHVTIPRTPSIDLRLILALYNSSLLNYYYRIVFPDTEKLFPQVKTVNVEKLPVPRVNGASERLKELVDELLAHAKSNGKMNGERTKLMEQIDKEVFSLYKLSDDQIARIKRSSYTNI